MKTKMRIAAAAMAVMMLATPLMSTAQAIEVFNKEKPVTEDRRGKRRGRRHRGGGSSDGAWVAAGILGAALIGSAIASNSSKKSQTYVYEQPGTVYYTQPSTPTYVYPSTTTYVQPGTTYVQPGTTYYYEQPGTTYVQPSSPTTYYYDANGNLVPY